MCTKMFKKGKNTQILDNWLDTVGLYRKAVGFDETCLFRSVSEQLYNGQFYHEKVRKECVEYGRLHPSEFSQFFEENKNWEQHLDLLEKHMVVCGKIEIHLISKNYERDIIVVYADKQKIINVTDCGYSEEPLMVCLLNADHFDSVYSKEHIENEGFCQSLAYKILYENVFGIPNVEETVKEMLYDGNNKRVLPDFEESDQNQNNIENNNNNNCLEESEAILKSPFPFKVAKALDPTMYRNIEYDSWSDVRKELKLGDWYKGDDKLKLGTKCKLLEPNGEYVECYIQQFQENRKKCEIYITKFAEKRLVNYKDLSPENDPKPWPLPYRFARNIQADNNAIKLAPMDKINSMRNKKREIMKHTRNKSVGDAPNNLKRNNNDDSISDFIGVPLQMQPPIMKASNNTNNMQPDHDEAAAAAAAIQPAYSLETPPNNNIHQSSERSFNEWGQPVAWVKYPEQQVEFPPQNSELFQFSHNIHPSNPFYGYKPVVAASAPVTPSGVSYTESPIAYYYHSPIQYPLTPVTSLIPPPNAAAAAETSEYREFSEVAEMSLDLESNLYLPQTPQSMGMYPHHSSMVSPMIYTAIPPGNLTMVVPASAGTPYTPVPSQRFLYPASGAEMIPAVPYSPYEAAQWSTGCSHPTTAQGFVFPNTPNI